MNDYEKFITEKSLTNKNEKYTIKFCGEREKNELYGGWEITDISQSINNFYYKNELLNTIASLEKGGTPLSNIYILDNSVMLSKQYKNYSKKLDLNNPNDVLNLYYLGFPTSIIPEPKSMILKISFSIFKSAYHFFNDLNNKSNNYLLPPIKKETLKEIYDYVYLSNKKDDISEKINSIIVNNIRDVNKNKEIDSKIKSWKELQRANFSKLNTISTILKDDDDISFEQKLELNKFSYRSFSSIFTSNSKPIICSYNDEENYMNIACFDMIARRYFTHDNYRFVETKQISQNSPLVLLLGVSFTGIIGFGGVITQWIQKGKIRKRQLLEQKNQDKENSELSKKNQKIDQEILKLDEENRQLEYEINKINSNKENNELPDIESNNHIINKLHDEVNDKMYNDFQKSEIKIKEFYDD